jgi:hypothetical protein
VFLSPFDGSHSYEERAALRDHEPTRLKERSERTGAGRAKLGEAPTRGLAKRRKCKLWLPFAIGNAEASTEIQGADVGSIFCNAQHGVHGGQQEICIKDATSDVLMKPIKLEAEALDARKGVLKLIEFDAELCVRSTGNHVMVMAAADIRVDPESEGSVPSNS